MRSLAPLPDISNSGDRPHIQNPQRGEATLNRSFIPRHTTAP
jgi:hypothetical protein